MKWRRIERNEVDVTNQTKIINCECLNNQIRSSLIEVSGCIIIQRWCHWNCAQPGDDTNSNPLVAIDLLRETIDIDRPRHAFKIKYFIYGMI